MNIETILTPALFYLHENGVEHKNVVVIDILRATTTMVVAHENGASQVLPVGSVEQALEYRSKGYLIAGERNGIQVEGFDFGNSPQEFTKERITNKPIALTTTNGTKAVELSKAARHIYIASFRNLTATANALIGEGSDVVLFCSGWKDKFNLEDTFFAGALCELLLKHGATLTDDASRMALNLWQSGKSNPADFLKDASHVQRFKSLHVESDLDACLKIDTYSKAIVL